MISLSAKVIARVLALFALLLVIVSTIGQSIKYLTVDYDNAFGLIPVVFVDNELSIPTMYSVIMLFICSLLLSIIFVFKKTHNDRFTLHWGVLALGFLYMAFDEGAMIHELLIDPMRRFMGDHNPDFFFFAWVIPGILLVLLLAVAFFRFLLHLPKRTRVQFMWAAALYLGGAIGLEMVGGQYGAAHGLKNLGFSLIATVEESLEMAGTILFIYGLLSYIQTCAPQFALRVTD